ncbi:MAG TPA: DMT family transporter, partial [Candidatus Limnocylindrales bacterium]
AGMAGVAVSARARRFAEAGVLVTVMIWSANFVVVKAAIDVVGPLTFTTARWAVAVVTLLLLARWRDGGVRSPGRYRWRLIGLGMLGFGAYQVLWTTGLTQITAGESALIIAAAPVATTLLAGAVRLDRLTAPKLAGALTAFAGVAIVVGAEAGVALGASLLGEALTLAAALLWAVYTVSGTRVLRHVDPLTATTWTMVGGFLFLLPFGVWDAVTSPPASIPPAAIVGVLYSGALAAGIANVLVFNAIRVVGPARTSTMQLLVPAGAVLLGAVFLGEAIAPAEVVGGVVIVLGVAMTRRTTVVPAALRARLEASG